MITGREHKSGHHLSRDGSEFGGAPERRCCRFENRKSAELSAAIFEVGDFKICGSNVTLSVEPSPSFRYTPRIRIARRVLVPTVLGKDEVTETLWQVSS